MSEGRESALRRLAVELRQARVEAEGRGDAWAAAVHTVDLEEVEERLRLRETWHRFFADAEHDVLITPAAPTAAIPAGTRALTVDGVERSFFDQTGWANLASHVGLPSLVMPVARNASGLPIGVQLVGPAHSDRTLLAMAEDLGSLLRATAGGFGF
ncbi:amidase family protein [Streptomyces canus]|uniref:amidase family protein n=1 Tax=Streptomyces canus TaxID=58343 RepID=UPI0036EE0CB7